MGAVAPDEDTACTQLVMDLALLGVRVLQISDPQEVFEIDEFKNLDDHLAENFQVIESGKRTVWGSIHCYLGDDEAWQLIGRFPLPKLTFYIRRPGLDPGSEVFAYFFNPISRSRSCRYSSAVIDIGYRFGCASPMQLSSVLIG